MSGEELSGSEIESDVVVRLVPVVAVANSRVIDRDGDMPWHLSGDLEQFKRTATDHPVVMGCETYESIAHQLGGLFSERHSVVPMIRDLDLPEGAGAVEPVESAITTTEDATDEMGVKTIYIVGDATIYGQFLGRAVGPVLIELDMAHEGDTRFPEWDRGKWVEIDRDDRDGFSSVTYGRKQPAVADRGAEESDE